MTDGIKRRDLDTENKREDHVRILEEDDHIHAKERSLRRNQPSQYLNLRLLASRIMIKPIFIVKTHGLRYFVMASICLFSRAAIIKCHSLDGLKIRNLY